MILIQPSMVQHVKIRIFVPDVFSFLTDHAEVSVVLVKKSHLRIDNVAFRVAIRAAAIEVEHTFFLGSGPQTFSLIEIGS